jgi:hypothetical protein
MASIGPNSVSVGENNTSIGTTGWWYPTEIYTSDDSRAEIFGSGTFTSFRLVARAPGFSVPAGATIDGIVVSVESSTLATLSATFNVKLWNGTSTTADNSIGTGKTMVPATFTDSVITLGSSSDLWGASLTDTIVNGAGFGVCLWLSSTSGLSRRWDVDHVQITVHYTTGGGGGSVQQSCVIMCG